MNRLVLTVICVLALVGCVAPAKKIVGPDGTEHQLITCGAIEQCYEGARETCQGPYKIVNTSSDTSGSDGNTSTMLKLLVKCGK